MTEFKTLVQKRRSHRIFTEETIDGEAVSLILRAGLMAPTSHGRKAWHFVVVEDKLDIEKIADAKETGSSFLKNAPLLVVVTGNPTEDDCWIEDGAIAAISMQYQAEELGLGTCWVQMSKRGLNDGTTANQVIQGVLDLPEEQYVLCVLGIGHAADAKEPHDEDDLKWENVHVGKF